MESYHANELILRNRLTGTENRLVLGYQGGGGAAEGWDGEGGGRGVQDWEHVCTRDEFMLMYSKTNKIL